MKAAISVKDGWAIITVENPQDLLDPEFVRKKMKRAKFVKRLA